MRERLKIEGMSLHNGMTELRLAERGDLLEQYDRNFTRLLSNPAIEEMSGIRAPSA